MYLQLSLVNLPVQTEVKKVAFGIETILCET